MFIFFSYLPISVSTVHCFCKLVYILQLSEFDNCKRYCAYNNVKGYVVTAIAKLVTWRAIFLSAERGPRWQSGNTGL